MNTRARIATVCQSQRFFPRADQNREFVMSLLEDALTLRPDLVCLPECFPTVSVAGGAADLAEPVPGPTTDAAAARARNARSYVVCPLLTRREGRVYNSAVILDRSGSIAGIYDKLRPVTTSPDYTVMERGVTPGDGDGVFNLDFGRVGVRICFDAVFPEDWEELERRDVRLVLWPSAYDGGDRLSVYAALHSYYVVTSVRTDRSRIIDPCGVLLAATDRLSNVAWQDFNLDFAVCHYDFNFGIPDQIRAEYGDSVRVRSDIDNGSFLVEPVDPGITTSSLMDRCGFEDARQYARRHRAAYASAKNGAVSPQHARHGDRPMYSKNPPERRGRQ